MRLADDLLGASGEEHPGGVRRACGGEGGVPDNAVLEAHGAAARMARVLRIRDKGGARLYPPAGDRRAGAATPWPKALWEGPLKRMAYAEAFQAARDVYGTGWSLWGNGAR